MCGRFIRTSPLDAIRSAFSATEGADVIVTPRYNICPGEDVLAVVQAGEARRVGWLTWGPFINARAESIAERPAFRNAVRRRRCLIVADGFYEWQHRGRQRMPFLFRLRASGPFALAGVWERRVAPDGRSFPSCTILTTTPNEIVAPVHDRMPVVLAPESHARWLDPETTDPSALRDLLRPYAAGGMSVHAVRPLVNSPRNDTPDCVTPFDYE